VTTARTLSKFLAAIFVAVLLWPAVGQAQDNSPATSATLDQALARLAEDNYVETAKAIDEIAATAAPSAIQVLEALADRRLFVDPASKAIFFKSRDGKILDAKSGQTLATEPAGAQLVRVNNRLRTTIESALGSLTLVASDPAKRIQAADSIFKSRDIKMLAALDIALSKEKDKRVRDSFERARAAILLLNADAAPADGALKAQLTAIDYLTRSNDQETLGLLRSALASATSPDVKTALEANIQRIEQRQRVLSFAQNIWFGLSLGSVLLLAAIGLAITFGVMGVINMAHGEMVMIGAYTTFVVQEGFRAYAPGAFDWSLPVAIPLAFLVTALVGIVIERGIIRFLYGRPLETLLATWGVSLILQQAVRTIFGPTNREVGAPSYMSGSFDVFGLTITYGRLWIVVFTLVVFGLLLLLLKATPLGLQMRAVTQNRRMAQSMGIRAGRIDAMTFALGSGIAGIAGVALSQIDNVSPNLGQSYIIDSFMVVVFGGVGNLWGTFVSAFFLGIANKFLEPFAGAVLAKIFILVLLILFIQKRPRGLFALKGRAVEA
jgi:urea transport system permease protein